ncbi:myosin heavy chain, clone 203 [Hylaeus anthracinus]|uniref:myosin heavy chain, clone 203 n=1 Tax=Hylaeus anthracinus TaxID=313031 RepID=UPI0023B9F018|nr:myosin heavy chain, clone 203 [Hylaeus anthracinus]
MSNSVNRPAPVTQRNKVPLAQSARNATHGDPANPTGEDASGVTKSQIGSARRSLAKPSVSPTAYKRPMSAAAGSAMKLENQYAIKKKRYQLIKKDLMDKQKVAQDLYNHMSQLREQVIASGAKDPGKLEDLKVEIGGPKQQPTIIEPVAENEQPESCVENMAVCEEFVDNLHRQLQEIPRKSQSLCRELLNKQSEFVAFVDSRLKASVEENEEGNSLVQVEAQLEVHRKDYESLQACMEDIKEMETKTVEEILKNVRNMVEEFEGQRTKLRELKGVGGQRELQSQLNATLEELQAERERSNQNKERLRQTEVQLQRARAKIRELEAHVANDEGKIQMLQANVKNLENQVRQKEQSVDMKMKEMQRTIKNSEALVFKVEKQRDSYESRLVELKEKMSSKENETMNKIKELSEKLNAVTAEVAAESEKRQEAEEALSELEERYKQLEEKSNQFCELAERNKDFTITEGSHSENEVRLFNELQAARAEVEMQKEMLAQLQQEKEEIVAVMHQAASNDEEDDTREKLATELVFKNNELKNLKMQYCELKKVAKNAQERNGTLEKQLIEIQTLLHSQSREGGKAGLSAHTIELQQQLSDLRNHLAGVVQQKEELETALTQKQLELEQRECVMREQNKFLKARDELLSMMKGKVDHENTDSSNNDENNEYTEKVQKNTAIAAKTEAIHELYSSLQAKQMQIMRLEKMVKLMEDQQDRAQAQRTRLENRIAQLELALQRNKEQRGKGFSIL